MPCYTSLNNDNICEIELNQRFCDGVFSPLSVPNICVGTYQASPSYRKLETNICENGELGLTLSVVTPCPVTFMVLAIVLPIVIVLVSLIAVTLGLYIHWRRKKQKNNADSKLTKDAEEEEAGKEKEVEMHDFL
jgi:hypothetical protein